MFQSVTVGPQEAKYLPELMALLAHDLRNPLSALLANVGFVRSALKGSNQDVEEALVDSTVSCAVLGQLISNLDVLGGLFLTAPAARVALGLGSAAADAASRAATAASLLDVEIDLSLGEALRVVVEPVFFGRSLDNLLANALQYSPAKSKVRVECSANGARGRVTILDAGPVVPSELRELTLTGDGQRIAKQRFEARYGRGIGLFCAVEAARIAGAELVVGERGGRATFELSAPISS